MLRVALLALIATLAAAPGSAQIALRLRWELKEDVFSGSGEEGASRVVLTLTNRDAKPLAARGWAIYWTALHQARPGTVRGGVAIEEVTGDLQRIVPGAGFSGLEPGRSVEFEYLTGLISNISFAPTAPYVVFDEDPAKGHALKDYVAVPFERPSQSGRDPRVVTPEAQYRDGRRRPRHSRGGAAAGLPEPTFPRTSGRATAPRAAARDRGGAGAAGRGGFRQGLSAPLSSPRPPGSRALPRCASKQARSRDRTRRKPTSWSSIPRPASASEATRRRASSTASSPCAASCRPLLLQEV